MKTDRYAIVDCPKCQGEGGEIQESYAGFDGFYGPAVREEWVACETCEGNGEVNRVERLAWLIGEARAWDAVIARGQALLRQAVAA